MPHIVQETLPLSAKKIREIDNEKFDIEVGIWETRTKYYYHIKVADFPWVCSRKKSDYPAVTRIPERYLELVEDIAKRKTAIVKPMRIEMQNWVTTNFRY